MKQFQPGVIVYLTFRKWRQRIKVQNHPQQPWQFNTSLGHLGPCHKAKTSSPKPQAKANHPNNNNKSK